MTTTSKEVFDHAFAYAKDATEKGSPETSQEEQAYYDEYVRHVEEFEDAYAKGAFAGIDAAK